MEHHIESVSAVARSFDDAADCFEHAAAALWDRHGRRLVSQSRIAPGMQVLDAACGTGASAIPAAHRVGRDGRVIAIDIAPRLLAIGRAKARAHRLRHLRFQFGDLRTPPVPAASQDAVLCGFGLDLVPDMVEGLQVLWHAVRPGGILALSLWGESRFEPAHGLFMAAISKELTESVPDFLPHERLADALKIRLAFSAAGLPEPEIVHEEGSHSLIDGDSWWRLALGSEYRCLINRLDPSTREQVAATISHRLAADHVSVLSTDVQYVTLRKE